jgi:hypothetical protein
VNHLLTKAELLDVMQAERSNWVALLDEVGRARLTEPGAAGDWSLKDVIAHLTYYEDAIAAWLDRARRGEPQPPSEFAGLNMDERNAAIYERNKDRAVEDIVRDSERAFQRSLDAVQGLRDEDLHDHEFTRRYDSEYSAHDLIEGDTYGHYQEHIAMVRGWLEKQAAAYAAAGDR